MKNFSVSSAVKMIAHLAPSLEGKTILASGTNGFLGRWLLRVVAELNHNILASPCKLIAIDIEKPSDSEANQIGDKENITYIKHDLTQKFLSLIESKVDYVIHMAGIASPVHYKEKPIRTIDVAIEGSRGLLEIARQQDARYLFCSSSEVYSTATIIPTPETYIGALRSDTERSCYDVSKLMGENLAWVFNKQYGVDTRVIRIFNSFGPGIRQDDYRILPKIATAILKNASLKVYKTERLPSRTYCPTANTIAGLFHALLNGPTCEIYNIGIDTPELTVPQLIERVQGVISRDIPIEIVQAPSVYVDEPLRRCPDISKAKNILGYDPQVTLDEGIKEFFDWALEEYLTH